MHMEQESGRVTMWPKRNTYPFDMPQISHHPQAHFLLTIIHKPLISLRELWLFRNPWLISKSLTWTCLQNGWRRSGSTWKGCQWSQFVRPRRWSIIKSWWTYELVSKYLIYLSLFSDKTDRFKGWSSMLAISLFPRDKAPPCPWKSRQGSLCCAGSGGDAWHCW